MKIAFCSDLHLDHHNHDIDLKSDADILILIGDIVEYNNYPLYKYWFEKVSKQYDHIYYILGNHEYYGHDVTKSIDFDLPKNFTILENDFVEFDDFILYGGTMWTDFKLCNPISMFDIEKRIADFKIIKNINKGYMIDKFHVFINKLDNIKTDKKLIVASHFSPSEQNIVEPFINSTINGYFHVPLDNYIYDSNIDYWLFGHIHSNHDFIINNTRVISNCYGYNKDSNFRIKVIEV